MVSIPSYFDSDVTQCTQIMHREVESMINRFALTTEEEFPSIRWQLHPQRQAIQEYTLWSEAGLILLSGRFFINSKSATGKSPVLMTMRFSLTHELGEGEELEHKKRRIEEIILPDADIIWNIPPAGLTDHVEITLRYSCHYPKEEGLPTAYAACVLGILTGKELAA